jgi:hypothetical protein
MSGYSVFQAHDGYAAQELCILLPDIELLILNTYGTGIDVGELCRTVRNRKHGMPILHIGSTIPVALPADVPTLSESFDSDALLESVRALIGQRKIQLGPALVEPKNRAIGHPNGRRREDSGSRPDVRRADILPLPVEPVPESVE